MRVTLSDIAKSCNLSTAAVSMALRGHANISRTTRDRVEQAAKELGYTPDPLLSSLSNYRRARRADCATIAFLTAWPTREGWQTSSRFLKRLHKGVEEEAKALGYQVDDYWLMESGLSQKRVSQVLNNRGIRALVIPHQLNPRIHLRFDWDSFAVVVMRAALGAPSFNYVNADQYQGVRLACHQLRHLGYRRPGFVSNAVFDKLSLGLWRAGFLIEVQTYHGKSASIPPLMLDKGEERTQFLKWFKRYRPDVILGPGFVHWVIQDAGLSAPDDVGFISLDLLDLDGSIAGICSNTEIVGANAVRILHGALQKGQYGIPIVAQGINVDGTWIAGRTVAKRMR